MSAPPAVAVLVALSLLSSLTGCAPRERSPSGVAAAGSTPAPTPSATGPPGRVPPARRAASVLVAQAPLTATFPSGQTASIRPVDTTPAGLLDVPDDIGVAGWWRGGSRLGDPFGSILVAAHVDSRVQGLGPFVELLSVRPGAHVRLESAGLRQEFSVRSRTLVPQGSLDDDSWIFDGSGALRLTLVTCAPPYDASRGGYQNLAVVTAVPLGPPERS
jgi:hypothetical protein